MVICPYCKWSYQPECEDDSEDLREEECEVCGKKFFLYDSISVTHITKPDCELNSEKHKYELKKMCAGNAYFCSVCDHCTIKKPE